MRILIIGASGYLGGHIARQCATLGHAVTGLSRSVQSDARVAQTGAAPLRGDLADMAHVARAATEYDAVIYAAQLPLEDEFAAMQALIARLSGLGKRMIFTSGTGLLSQRTDGEWSEDSFAEDDPFIPSKYIGLRHATEHLVRAAGWSGAINAMVVRPPLIWGHGGCGFIAQFYRDAFTTGSVGYLGRGLNLYSNVHVDDLAAVYGLALERGTSGALYHAVSGEVCNRAIAEAVATHVGVPAQSIDFAEGVRRWGKFQTLIGMATCSRSRAPRTRRDLDWRPQHRDLLEDIGHPAYLALRDETRQA